MHVEWSLLVLEYLMTNAYLHLCRYFQPGCGASREARNLNNQLTTAPPELKTVVSPPFFQKENNTFISEIVWVNMLQLYPWDIIFWRYVCFPIVHYSVREKSISEKKQSFPVYPSLHKTFILLWSLLLKSSTRVNYKYLEVHILSFQNSIFFWHSFHYQGIKY